MHLPLYLGQIVPAYSSMSGAISSLMHPASVLFASAHAYYAVSVLSILLACFREGPSKSIRQVLKVVSIALACL